MVPGWLRRLAYAAVLLHGTLILVNVARPDTCADVFRIDHHVSGCCANSAVTRMGAEGRDCCGYGSVEDRDPAAFASPLVVAAAPAVTLSVSVLEAPEARLPRPVSTIPERPPDRARRTTVLLL